MVFFVPETLYSLSHLNLMIVLFYVWRNWGSEKLNNLPKDLRRLNIRGGAFPGNQTDGWRSSRDSSIRDNLLGVRTHGVHLGCSLTLDISWESFLKFFQKTELHAQIKIL